MVRCGPFIVRGVFGKPTVRGGWCDLADRGVGAPVVVDVHELIDEGLEAGEIRRGWSGGHPFLHCLLEPFNFPGGCWVVGSGVFLGDVQITKPGLDLVSAASIAGKPGGVNKPVVGQHRGREPIGFSGLVERVKHDVAGDPPVAADVERVSGVVIEPGDCFGVVAVSEPDVGEV